MKGYQSSSVLLRHWFDAFFVVQTQGWICGMMIMIMMMLMGCGQQGDDADPDDDDDDDYKDVFDTWKYFTTLTDI